MDKKKNKKEESESTDIDDLDVFDELGQGDAEEISEAAPDAPEDLKFTGFEEQGSAASAKPDQFSAGNEVPVVVSSPLEQKRAAAYEMADSLIELAPDVPVNLVAVIGKTSTTVGDLMKYRIGQVIELGRPPGESVDVVANGRLIARGELVDIDGQLGVRILKMVK